LVYTWSQDGKINKVFLPQWGPDHKVFVEVIRNKQIEKAKETVLGHVERGLARVATHFIEEVKPKKKVAKR
jgi:hypothetical protein